MTAPDETYIHTIVNLFESSSITQNGAVVRVGSVTITAHQPGQLRRLADALIAADNALVGAA